MTICQKHKTKTDEMSYISSILRQSLQTFAIKSNVETFTNNLSKLKQLVDKLTAEHINFDQRYMNNEIWQNEKKAPMSYIEIYEDCYVNIAVFVIKPGMKLPLHDHPHMYGFLKVIGGTVKIRSLSLNTELTRKLESSKKCEMTYPDQSKILIAEKMEDLVLDSSSECCALDPNKGNVHEIESIGGPAAFLDVLSPPYDADIPVYGRRKCTYYKISDRFDNDVYKLIEMPSPSWFWSDHGPYLGPPLYDKNLYEFFQQNFNNKLN